MHIQKKTFNINIQIFCKLALNEKLIDDTKIEKDYKHIISIIIPSYNKQNIIKIRKEYSESKF